MFLSNGASAIESGGQWTSYEMCPVDAAQAPKTHPEAGFVALKLAQGGQGGFVPLTNRPGAAAGAAQAVPPSPEEKTAQVEKDAYDQGFAQGERDGYELGEKRALKIVEKVEQLLEEMTRVKAELVRQYEKELLSVMAAICEKVVHTHVRLDATAVKNNILAALEMTAEKREVTIKINPEDFEYVEGLRPELFSGHGDVKSIMLTSDPAVARGGCRLETAGGDVDATLATQLDIIRRSLEEAYTG